MHNSSKFFLLLFSCCFFYGVPVKSQVQKENTVKQIIWRQPGKEYYSVNSYVTYLRFEGAVYGEKYMPLCNEKIKINPSTNSVTAELLDPHFVPLEEISLIEEFKNKISSSVEVSVRISYERKIPFALITFLPLRKNPATGVYEKLVSFNISIKEGNDGRETKVLPTYTTTSVLSSGKWYKLGVSLNGVYKMNDSFLKQLGINLANIDPRNIRIYGSGGGMLPFANSVSRNDDLVENAIFIAGENDGHFDVDDYILFYGSGQLKWKYSLADSLFHHKDNYYSDTTYYFLTTDLGPGRRIGPQISSTLTPTYLVNTFNDYALHEVDLVNCVKSGKEWFGESFDALNRTRDFQFSFPNLITSSQVGLWSDVLAHSVQPEPSCTYSINVNGIPVMTQVIPSGSPVYYAPCANESVGNAWINVSSSNITVRMIFNPATNTSQGWLNYLELNVMRQLTMHGSQMEFRSVPSIGSGNVSEFSLAGATSSTKIWDVSDALTVRQQEGIFSNGNFIFRIPTDSLHEFIAFTDQSFLTPRAAGIVENQNIHGIMSADFVIVTPPQFISQAERLAEHHRGYDQLSVSVVTTNQIYNEFSSGSQDVSAIRDFMRMLYNRNQNQAMLPKYLLLFGDASYDNKHRIYNNTNFIVSYQSDNSLDPTSTFISDDFFGFLDSNDGYWSDNDTYSLLDIGIGRMPLKSNAEAAAAVDKIINYSTNGINTANPVNCNSAISGFGEWRNIASYVADDEDGGTHLIQAEALAAKVDTTYQWYNIDKIYLDAYQQISTPGGQRYPAAQAAFIQRVERGSLFTTYVGHGGEVGLAHERVLTVEDIKNWTNFNRLSAFLTATCEFTRIDDPERTSAGEFVFLNSKGAGVALFTTTRLAFSGSNFSLCRSFNKFLFEPLNGLMPTLGDICRLTKNDYRDPHVKNFLLVGDPAMKLAYPRWNVVTTSINNNLISATADTIKALTRVTITGEVRDDNGQLMNGFNGVLIPSIYDKEVTYYTLSNDPGSPVIPFKLRKNVLFKGKATVVNGTFSFSFIMPKDISFQYGTGKISYYAFNGLTDAKGFYENVIVGGIGSDSTVTDDKRGPEIKLFMNDDKFVSGGMTNPSPNVYALISDESGINTAGNGIGHDITITVDGDKLYTANDFFEADLDSYQKGKISFPLTGLSDGKHTLKLKVWDIFNNSSETTIDFYVISSKEITLNHVYNYPNPFTTHTKFMFEHNRACVPMSVQVQIFTVTGKLVKTISEYIVCDGFRFDNLDWDGRDDYGDKIGRGVYIYRLRVQTADGSTADKMEKLVIL